MTDLDALRARYTKRVTVHGVVSSYESERLDTDLMLADIAAIEERMAMQDEAIAHLEADLARLARVEAAAREWMALRIPLDQEHTLEVWAKADRNLIEALTTPHRGRGGMSNVYWHHYGEHATWLQRWPLRFIGLGVLLMTDNVVANLWHYRGMLWNLGCWVMSRHTPTMQREGAAE